MGSGVQNVRFLRLLILFVAVVLTIFMYASYYSSRSLSLPHIRTIKSNNNNNITNSIALESKDTTGGKINIIPGIVKHEPNVFKNTYLHHEVANIPAKHHREPTIDVDAPADADVEVEPALDERELIKDQQYQQIVENNIDNNSNTSGVQLQPIEQIENNAKVVDSDVLIPTSNLQKFIENADKILKNLTNLPLVAGISHKNEIKPSIEIKNAPSDGVISKIVGNNDLKIDKNKSNNNINTTTTTTTAALHKHIPSSSVDLSQGIPTNQIYESGHLDDEINIEQICPNEGSGIKLLIMITSAQAHQEARLAIRQTWGHFGGRRDVATLFILGRSNNETLNTALTQENFIYGDLIRGQFMDTYNNLTLKTISTLEWVDRHCSRVKHVLKTDDDMFINVPKLLSFLDKHSKEKRIIYGRLAKKWKPIRNPKSKYYVSPKQFSATIFPPFTTGPAYVLSADTVHDLYQRALQQTYLKLEDVFTTGIIAQQLGIRRVHVNEFLNRRIAFNPCNIRKTISVHMIKSNEQFDLWKKLLDKTTKCK